MEFEDADAVNQAIRMLSLRHRARAAALLAPLGLHPGQEALLLQLARTGPMIQAQLSEALGVEPPSVTLMTRKLEASGHVRRKPSPSDKRASIVELTDSGIALTDLVKQLWCALAEETVAGLPAETVTELPGILRTLTGNVDTSRSATAAAASRPSGRSGPTAVSPPSPSNPASPNAHASAGHATTASEARSPRSRTAAATTPGLPTSTSAPAPVDGRTHTRSGSSAGPGAG